MVMNRTSDLLSLSCTHCPPCASLRLSPADSSIGDALRLLAALCAVILTVLLAARKLAPVLGVEGEVEAAMLWLARQLGLPQPPAPPPLPPPMPSTTAAAGNGTGTAPNAGAGTSPVAPDYYQDQEGYTCVGKLRVSSQRLGYG